jgi:hypothetical protein
VPFPIGLQSAVLMTALEPWNISRCGVTNHIEIAVYFKTLASIRVISVVHDSRTAISVQPLINERVTYLYSDGTAIGLNCILRLLQDKNLKNEDGLATAPHNVTCESQR